VEFLSGRRVRLSYGFSSERELGDWYEYPRDAGRGAWEVKDGVLVGRGRLGLRHSWRLRREVAVRVQYAGTPSGRLHLFDPGTGRGVAETDFRAVYLVGFPPDVLGKGARGGPNGLTDIVFSAADGVLRLAAGRDVLYRRAFRPDAEGYCGIYCWGHKLRIDSLQLEGEIEAGWARRELSRLAAIERIENAPGPEKRGTPILPGSGRLPWESAGYDPVKRGRGGEYLFEAGATPFRVVVGSTTWSDYVVEGWVYLTAIGRVSLEGRTDPRRLQSGHARVEFAANRIILRTRDGGVTGRKEFSVAQMAAKQVVPFRVEWLRSLLTAEVAGRQVARANLRCPETGSLVIKGTGEGSQVGGLKVRLLRKARDLPTRSEPREAVGRDARDTEAAHRHPGRKPR